MICQLIQGFFSKEFFFFGGGGGGLGGTLHCDHLNFIQDFVLNHL